MGSPLPTESPRVAWGIPLSFAVIVGGLVIWRACVGRDAEPPAPSAAPSAATSESAAAPKPPPAPRCVEISPEPFVIGEPAARRPPPEPAPMIEAGPPDESAEDTEDEIAPFAVEIGRGAVYEGGFAAGVRRDAEGGAIAMVATMGSDGRDGKLVKLVRTRGDLDPPVVAGAGNAVLAALLEPNASGRSIKIAKVVGGEVTWGIELSEGRDESLALDLAASGARALIVWDDVPRDAKHSSVMLSSFDVATMRSVTSARPVSSPKVDADTPRLVVRPGGYWLGYIARAEEVHRPATKADPQKAEAADKGLAHSLPKPGQLKADDDGDDDTGGEAITNAWVEVMPLDENGAPTATARAVTPRDGHVLAFDLELGEDSAALIAWRDDDAPTGSVGGRLSSALIRAGGNVEAHVIAEESGGAGVPDLLPGWLVVSGANGPTRIASISAKGELLGALDPEPSLGAGEPLAASRGQILMARPQGKAMRLAVVRCSPALITPGAPGASSTPLPATSGAP